MGESIAPYPKSASIARSGGRSKCLPSRLAKGERPPGNWHLNGEQLRDLVRSDVAQPASHTFGLKPVDNNRARFDKTIRPHRQPGFELDELDLATMVILESVQDPILPRGGDESGVPLAIPLAKTPRPIVRRAPALSRDVTGPTSGNAARRCPTGSGPSCGVPR